jgi:hypothetical protein
LSEEWISFVPIRVRSNVTAQRQRAVAPGAGSHMLVRPSTVVAGSSSIPVPSPATAASSTALDALNYFLRDNPSPSTFFNQSA